MMARLLLLSGAWLLVGLTEAPSLPTPLPPLQAAKEGRALVEEMLALKPVQNTTNTGMLNIRDARGKRRKVAVKFEIIAGEPTWVSTYATFDGSNTNTVKLTIDHTSGKPNEYRLEGGEKMLSGNQTMIPFAGSDFWVADLGLEFLHWPEQRVLRKEIRRGQSCNVLESINPTPAPGAYRRVVSWIDIDTDGIINAEAYDFNGKLLKEFATKKIKKVQGQWQLQEMEIGNRQTGSRTQIEFDVDSD